MDSFLAFKSLWIYKLCLLSILILSGNVNIRLNEYKHHSMGGIGLVSGRPTEDKEDPPNPPPSESSEGDDETNVEDDNQAAGIYDHIDLNEVIEKCPEATGCPASIQYYLVCGSDGVIYKNIGVLSCAQRCNIALKLTNFGPCEGAKPLPRSTLPPVSSSSTTVVNFFGVDINPESQLEFDKEKDKEFINTLKKRIEGRVGHFTLSPEWEEYCKENKNKCYRGFDPGYNPVLYLIPVQPYTKKELWRQSHDDIVRRQHNRLTNGADPTTIKYSHGQSSYLTDPELDY